MGCHLLLQVIYGAVVKESACQCRDIRDLGSILGLGRSPGGGNGNPVQYSCLENSMDRAAWGGYGPWDHKESETTEHTQGPNSHTYNRRWILYHWVSRETFSSVQLLSRIQLFVTHGLQHARPPCPSSTPGVYSNSSPLSGWCHLTISSSVIPFSSRLQSFPAQGLFKWVSSLHQVAKLLEFQLQHQSFQWIFTDFL